MNKKELEYIKYAAHMKGLNKSINSKKITNNITVVPLGYISTIVEELINEYNLSINNENI